jgi:hypothetical protein
MHEIFKTKLAESNISITNLEIGIGCPRNYLSRFINGDQTLPKKWEPKIEEYLALHPNPVINAVSLTATDLPEELATKVDFSPNTAASYDSERMTGIEDEFDFTKAAARWALRSDLEELERKYLAALAENERLTKEIAVLKAPKHFNGDYSGTDRKILNPNADRTKQLVEPEKGTPAYYLRYGKFGDERDSQ